MTDEQAKTIEQRINNAVLEALSHLDDVLKDVGASDAVVDEFKGSVASIATQVAAFGISQLENLVIKNLK